MTVRSMSPADAKARLGASDFLLLDVREPGELRLAKVDGATHIPMRAVAARAHELDRTKEIAVLCHHGGRSEMVAQFLARAGFPRVANVDGGIDAWSATVDPAVPRY